ncbi:Glycosyl transferases group 1 [Rosistilla ulvae]|uniref:Glycosyl transferases group 1 n=1 Tax=Rosistilla ulvae TaxID=1930277 RepID=A0A517LV58_9BACT|nr:glycosyltransferase [Rosistilla ulvae]QDS86513.1 Glycosyl transferases group 1 [Rosistilla ulvae]
MPAAKKVCFLGLNAYPAIQGRSGTTVGGLESGMWTIARTLASTSDDLAISILVSESRRPANAVVDHVELHTILDPLKNTRLQVSQSLNLQALKQARFRSLLRLAWQVPLLAVTRPFRDRRPIVSRIAEHIRRIDPAICLVFGTGNDQLACIRAANEVGAKSIACIVSNADAPSSPDDMQVSTRNEYGETVQARQETLRLASAIICQTQCQRDQVRKTLNLEAHVIKGGIRIDRWTPSKPRVHPEGPVLWIGRYDTWHKRPWLCLEIAKRCPDLQFEMILNPGSVLVEQELREAVPDNVKILDFVPYAEMPKRYHNALAYLSTGAAEFEGFPNVILEASAAGTPVVSLEDFDGYLAASGAGWGTDNDLDLAAQRLRELKENAATWQRCSEAAQRWVRSEHSIRINCERYKARIDQLLDRSS